MGGCRCESVKASGRGVGVNPYIYRERDAWVKGCSREAGNERVK